ncbi:MULTISPECIES: class I ribonucleotide reductase maintenance protein YfaE [unclassified Erwinia]|uniref:class I ribonucleotide reductase maintenance protein YfaE n=1 Tax=unclassified Erwinia TaxID=2622719 RepID=UPI00082C7F8D|nr:class I ribonucleotide reductase maintenance protein YfaE [Erwinia sp. ErVv1]
MAGTIITLRTSGTQLHCQDEHRSLLDALEFHQIRVEYQCREGYCGSCRTRLLKGEVCYAATPLAFVQEGEILPCCCLAKGDIEIEM